MSLHEAQQLLQGLKLGDIGPDTLKLDGGEACLKLWLGKRYSNTGNIDMFRSDPTVAPAVELATYWWLAVLIHNELNPTCAVPYKAWHQWAYEMSVRCTIIDEYVYRKEERWPCAGKSAGMFNKLWIWL